MPGMSATTFADELLKTTDKDNPEFVAFPTTPQEIAEAWMKPLRAMFEEATSPPLAAAAAPAAYAAGVSAMAPLVVLPPLPPPAIPIAAAALVAGFTAFAGVIAAQNIPTQAIPPPAPFVPPITPPTPSPAPPATAIATAALAWAKTGLQGPPPAAPAIPWG